MVVCFRALETDDYCHVNATYYLLAERLLRKQQEIQEIEASQWTNKLDSEHKKPLLAPLALSPRWVPLKHLIESYITISSFSVEIGMALGLLCHVNFTLYLLALVSGGSSDVKRSSCTTSCTPCCSIFCHSYIFSRDALVGSSTSWCYQCIASWGAPFFFSPASFREYNVLTRLHLFLCIHVRQIFFG